MSDLTIGCQSAIAIAADKAQCARADFSAKCTLAPDWQPVGKLPASLFTFIKLRLEGKGKGKPKQRAQRRPRGKDTRKVESQLESSAGSELLPVKVASTFLFLLPYRNNH